MNNVSNYFGTHQTMGLIIGGAAGAAIGHFLVKKGMTWTVLLTAAGIAGGWYLGHNVAQSSASTSTTTAPAGQ